MLIFFSDLFFSMVAEFVSARSMLGSALVLGLYWSSSWEGAGVASRGHIHTGEYADG